MSLTDLPALILDTVLGHLAILFLSAANTDPDAARDAAHRMLAAYHPETEDELHLAADIISFGFHALEALSQSAAPDTSLSRKLRLRGSAVSLSREAHKARRKLDQLQRDRRTAPAAEARAPEPPNPSAETLPPPVAQTPQPPAQHPTRHPAPTWTQASPQYQAAKRIAENLKKQHAPRPDAQLPSL